MSSLSCHHASRQRLVENITLLWTLNEIPEQPKDNIAFLEDSGTRQLSLERERQLADSFAFISATTDDILRVMAVSIEEDADKAGITIRLASNTGDLSSMKKALDGITKILEKAATRIDSRTAIRRELFIQIVTLDRIRILSRLRSWHAKSTRKTAGKPALLALLSRTVNNPSIKANGESAKAKVAKARTQTKQMVEAFDEFESTYDVRDPSLSEQRLVDVLIQAYEFDINSLQVALQTPSLIDPGLVTFLPQAISKLGRYYCVTCDLIDAVRNSQYTIFGHITIKVLDEPVLDTSSITKGLLDFDKSLERITGLSQQQQLVRYGTNALSLARTKFHARISSRTPLWKIHAEIQLLFFYEHNIDISPPRYICSSKSACYLCDLFVKLHGKFCSPRTHGRLYDRWILPEWSVYQSLHHRNIQSAIDRCNTRLESKISQILSTRRPSFQHPNESVLHWREPWSSNSTIPAKEIRHSVTERSEDTKNPVIKELDKVTRSGSPNDSPSSETTIEKRVVDSGKPSGGNVMPNTGSVVTLLSRGDTICHRLTRPCDTLIVQTDAIILHASSDWNPTDSTEPASGAIITQDACWVQVKWLSHGGHITDRDQGVDSVDLETLSSTTDSLQERTLEGGSVFSQKALYVQVGEHVLEVQYYLGSSQHG